MCKECNINPVYEFTNKRKLCKKCFIKYFQKKVLYTIRRFGMIKKDEVIGYENNLDFRSVVLEDILKIFSEKWMIEIVNLPSKKKINKITVPFTIDLGANKIIYTLIHGKTNELKEISPVEKSKYKTLIKPLYLFLDKEVLLYAKLKKLKFKEEKPDRDKVLIFMDRLEIKHPEVKRAIVNGYLGIN